MSTAQFQKVADSLEESARFHKRQERAHREAAQRDRQSLAAFLSACEEAGIRVEVRHGDA